MRREPLRSAWRRVAHALLVFGGWALFFGFWWKVLRAPWPGYDRLVLLILVIVVVVPTVTLLWIAHNIRIYRRKGPRRNVRVVPERYDRDWEGRQVVADWTQARRAEEVLIVSEEDVKRYEIAKG